MTENPYKLFAETLHKLPNGYPPTEDGIELRILEYLCSPEEALIASKLRMSFQTVDTIAGDTGFDMKDARKMLKDLSRRGIIRVSRSEDGLGFALLPFVVGIYEEQLPNMNEDLAKLIESYFKGGFQKTLEISPNYLRVIPIEQDIAIDTEIQPYEDAHKIVDGAQSWGVLDCVCRVQKAMIGEGCEHPVDVCMAMYPYPNVFDNHSYITALTKEEAYEVLHRSRQAGLVHQVTNAKEGMTFVCNCCTCSCGILRGIAELGHANFIARSAFVNTVNDEFCNACETCVEFCQFDALQLDYDEMVVKVSDTKCVGCGVCVPTCPEEALVLIRRKEEEILPIPATRKDWAIERADFRGIDLDQVR